MSAWTARFASRCPTRIPDPLPRLRPRVLKKQCSGMSKSRAPRGAGEKHHTQIFFQFLDSARQRRLLDVQPLGRAGKVEFFSDR